MYVNTWRRMQRGQSQALFSGVQWQGKRQWHKPKHRRFPLNIRKHFFTVRVKEHWHRLPREVVVSLLGGLQKPSGRVLAVGDPAWAGGLDKLTFRGPFQPQSFCDYVNIRHHVSTHVISWNFCDPGRLLFLKKSCSNFCLILKFSKWPRNSCPQNWGLV